MDDEYWVPEHVRGYLRGRGFLSPLEAIDEHIRAWHDWMRSLGTFYDSRNLGQSTPDEGEVRVSFNDSIISDTAAEKKQDMFEVGITMQVWEYRAKWYGEDEDTAKANAQGLGVGRKKSVPVD